MRTAGYLTLNIRHLPGSCGFSGTGKTDWNFADNGRLYDSDDWSDLKTGQPFFAQINLQETHRPFDAAPLVDPSRVVISPNYPDHPVTCRDWAQYL
jgi:N-sulfoglucosamine sulfohydrolase